MKRKNKVLLFSFAYLFSSIFIVLLLYVFMPKQLLITINTVSYIFLAACFILIFLPASNKKIGGNEIKTKHPFIQWLAIILSVEIGAMSLFLLQNNLLTNSNQIITQASTLMNWNLFPWTLVVIMAVVLSQVIKKNPLTPFSNNFPSFSPLFLSTIIKRTADAYIKTITRLFIFINLGFIILQLCSFLINRSQGRKSSQQTTLA